MYFIDKQYKLHSLFKMTKTQTDSTSSLTKESAFGYDNAIAQ